MSALAPFGLVEVGAEFGAELDNYPGSGSWDSFYVAQFLKDKYKHTIQLISCQNMVEFQCQPIKLIFHI